MNKFVFFILSFAFSYSLKAQCDVAKYDIFTPNGSPVLTYVMCESSSSIRAGFDSYYASAWPNAQQIKTFDNYSSTRRFNCHGYAWLYSDGGPDRWIGRDQDNRDPDVYMNDGSYFQVSSEVYPGKVFWARPGDHSAVTTAQPGIFISKWNEYPLMKHAWNYTPYGTSGLKYYVRTPVISGPDLVPCIGTVTYSLPASVTSITWTTALQIVSGQGTNSLTVSKPSGSSQGELITANGTYYGSSLNVSKIVSVGVRYITSVSGPSSVDKGVSATFTAYPIIYASEGDYEWMVTPATGVSQSKWQNVNYITFSQTGSYMVGVRSTSSCTTPGTYKTTTVSVN